MYKGTTNIWNEAKNYKDLANNWQDKNVYLCGVLSDVCVVQAMNGLLKRGAKVIIIEDLCQGAQMQISDILQVDPYSRYVESGHLKSITTAQFFRSQLLSKKIEHNLVNRAIGE